MITKEDVRNAYSVLERYRNMKSTLDARILENRRVWRKLTGNTGSSKSDENTENTTAWLFNLVANRHADAIDSYPEAIITGREEGDIGKAKTLSDILPIICEHNGFEKLWSELWWSKLIDGTCVTGVFWDNSMCRGLGDIALRQIDLLSIYWDFGVKDIQNSRNVFTVESVLNEELTERYPFLEGKLGAGKLSMFLQDTPDDGQERSP